MRVRPLLLVPGEPWRAMYRPVTRRWPSMRAAVVGSSLTAGWSVSPADSAAAVSASGPISGAFGWVAAISGSSAEVQNPVSGQVTVNWTPSTHFTHMIGVWATSVDVGDCVTITGSSSKGTITAKSVAIAQAQGGRCTGTNGVDGPSPSESSSTVKASSDGGLAQTSVGPGTALRVPVGTGGMVLTSGKVTMISATRLTMLGYASAGSPRATTKFAKAKPRTTVSKSSALKVTTFEVELAPSTAYTQYEPTAASTLAVGDCVTATGSSTSTGALNAVAVEITATGVKSCTTGGGVVSGGQANG